MAGTKLLSWIFGKSKLPIYIQNNRHDDWIWPLSYIPRRWTGFAFPMPPHKVWGNANMDWVEVEPDYELAPDAQTTVQSSRYGGESLQVLSMEPVHPSGQWSIQSVWLGFRLPCYFTATKSLFGRRFYINFGLKPDVTYNPDNKTRNWFWAFPEMSLTFLKEKQDAIK